MKTAKYLFGIYAGFTLLFTLLMLSGIPNLIGVVIVFAVCTVTVPPICWLAGLP